MPYAPSAAGQPPAVVVVSSTAQGTAVDLSKYKDRHFAAAPTLPHMSPVHHWYRHRRLLAERRPNIPSMENLNRTLVSELALDAPAHGGGAIESYPFVVASYTGDIANDRFAYPAYPMANAEQFHHCFENSVQPYPIGRLYNHHLLIRSGWEPETRPYLCASAKQYCLRCCWAGIAVQSTKKSFSMIFGPVLSMRVAYWLVHQTR